MAYYDQASLKQHARRLINPYAKAAFLDTCVPYARILDVGCGNNSPLLVKSIRPDAYYVGLDVADYNQSVDPVRHADEYIVVPRQQFAEKIFEMSESFDAVISAHNIEHCDQPRRVLIAMLRALKRHGRIFLSFPCEESVRFPSRRGTLNFFDDPTHLTLPDYEEVLTTIKAEAFLIDIAVKRYRPLYHYLRGLIAEPFSGLQKKVMYGTWALYGFETIIWATRMRVPKPCN